MYPIFTPNLEMGTTAFHLSAEKLNKLDIPWDVVNAEQDHVPVLFFSQKKRVP